MSNVGRKASSSVAAKAPGARTPPGISVWTNGQLAYGACCVFLLCYGWHAFRDNFIGRGVCLLFVVIIYFQLSTGTWNQNARQLRRRSDQEGREALRRVKDRMVSRVFR